MNPSADCMLSTNTDTYRDPMPVTAVRYYPSCPELFTYPLCPRCSLPMDHEYQRFCDHCGQALDWSVFSGAVVIVTNTPKEAR